MTGLSLQFWLDVIFRQSNWKSKQHISFFIRWIFWGGFVSFAGLKCFFLLCNFDDSWPGCWETLDRLILLFLYPTIIYIFIYTAEFYTIHCLPFDVNERIKKCGGENSNCVSTSIIAFRMGSVFLLFAFPKLAVIFWRTHASHRNIAPWEISRSFSLTEIANVYTL